MKSLLSSRCIILVLISLLSLFSLSYAESLKQCGARFKVDLERDPRGNVSQYQYTGTPRGLLPGHPAPTLTTYKGCLHYCGATPHLYPWEKISDTLTTWILPIAGGLLLQMPFESNRFWSTTFVMCRWLGNPVISLMCILWNIKVTGRCSLFLDMSVPRDQTPGYSSDEGRLRLLREVMERLGNWVYGIEAVEEYADGASVGDRTSFAELRDSLYVLSVLNQFSFNRAHPANANLKTFLVFALFSRDLEDAKNNALREKRAKVADDLRTMRKHNVVPVLISLLWFCLSLAISIYKAHIQLGANAAAHDLALGLLMGWLPVLVSCTIVDRNPSNAYHTHLILRDFLHHASSIWTSSSGQHLLPDMLNEPLLLGFCGQARRKWHYGVAHSIVADLEASLPRRDRDILRIYEEGSLGAGVGCNEALWRFDVLEIWHMLCAALIVGLSLTGAFIISFNTPTVGLGCRSGGYLIFGTLATTCLTLEMAGWALHSYAVPRPGCRGLVNGLRVVITFLELVNTAWLVYILMAQTFGTYNSCDCVTSRWGGGGGYADFEDTEYYRSHYHITSYWVVGTVLGCLPLAAIPYVVYAWTTQSFMSTRDYAKAMRGLIRVRRLKYYLHPDLVYAVLVEWPFRMSGRPYRSLTWRR